MHRSLGAVADAYDDRRGYVEVVDDGRRADYGSGPHMALMAAAVGLARRDLAEPAFSAGARVFLRSSLVGLFADCIGYGGSFE